MPSQMYYTQIEIDSIFTQLSNRITALEGIFATQPSIVTSDDVRRIPHVPQWVVNA